MAQNVFQAKATSTDIDSSSNLIRIVRIDRINL